MSSSSSTTPASSSTAPAPAPARTGRSYDAYPIHTARELAPGIMDDGTISASHPLVQQFLAYTTRKFLAAEARAAAAGKHKDKRWHGQHKHPLVTRWRVMHGGGARVADVHAALGPGVTARLAAAVFALGALSVYSHWARPAHWAFWAVNVVEETAGVVHQVVRADPKVIHVPDEVAWVDVEMAVNVLRVWHGGFVPRQRKKKQAVSDGAKDDSDGEAKTTNTNGKRTAVEDSPPVHAKRTRTTEKRNLVPTRQSARIRNGAPGEPAPDPMPDTVPTPPLQNAPEPIVDEPEAMAVDVEPVETATAQSSKKSRSKPVRPRRSTGGKKRKAARKPRASSGDAPSEQPLPAPPSSSPYTIRIPARSAPPSASPSPVSHQLVDVVSAPPVASASPASGETTPAASRESTAVGTPCSGLSTRVGTPLPEFEVKVEAIVAKVKLVREIPAPMRSSARIRAKSVAGAPHRR